MRFTNKVVVVTGAGSGLGRAVAKGFAREGGSVLLVDINQQGLQDTQEEIGDSAKILAIDLSTRAACQQVVNEAIKHWGKLNVLCNIAGIVRMGSIASVTEDDWASLVACNMAAPFWLSQAALPHLLETKGNIINCASQSAHKGAAYVVPYSMTKGAVVMMTKSMAMETIHQPVRINAVSPGTMMTGMSTLEMPEDMNFDLLKRYGGEREPAQPEDLVGMFLYVASDDAGIVHGAILCADGGTTAD